MTAGPAPLTPVPMVVKIPPPIMVPKPIATRSLAVSARRSLLLLLSSRSFSTELVAKSEDTKDISRGRSHGGAGRPPPKAVQEIPAAAAKGARHAHRLPLPRLDRAARSARRAARHRVHRGRRRRVAAPRTSRRRCTLALAGLLRRRPGRRAGTLRAAARLAAADDDWIRPGRIARRAARRDDHERRRF